MSLNIETQRSNGEVVILVVGEVDLYSSPELRKAILKTTSKADIVVVDLGEVAYIDSSGVATLVEGLRSARDRNARFVLARPSKAVKQVLELARLDSVFEVR